MSPRWDEVDVDIELETLAVWDERTALSLAPLAGADLMPAAPVVPIPRPARRPEHPDHAGAGATTQEPQTRSSSKSIARYGRVDLLCTDELGCTELDHRGAELLFQVLTGREERNSVAIASNESFSGWTKTFTDPRPCSAIVDRLTFNGTIIEAGTDSYRLATTRARAEEPAKAGRPPRQLTRDAGLPARPGPELTRRETLAPQPVLGIDDPLGLDHHERSRCWFIERTRPFDMVGLPAERRPVVPEIGVVPGQHASPPEELSTSAAGLSDQRCKDPHRHPGVSREVPHLRRTRSRGEHHREVEVEVPHRRGQRPFRPCRREHAHVLRRQQIEYPLFQTISTEALLR
ncbi:hypothetical protein Sspor_04400 [Streptomyces spororaveus]|uniref:IstB-like ATP-binding domain-containing protein n=1 Tax=Streptomyces spororaveus TaxID=284039 RepID=A0ABQ3T3C3_9ACTN|nr:hypothetical protein Sspor_04400 [Streptomyces spororaveus]